MKTLKRKWNKTLLKKRSRYEEFFKKEINYKHKNLNNKIWNLIGNLFKKQVYLVFMTKF